MSKSLGNFFTLRDLFAKGFTGREIRSLLLSAHYRETFNFTLEGLNASRAALQRLDECVAKLREISGGATSAGSEESAFRHQFAGALQDDLNVSAAWGAVFEWVRETNRKIADGSLAPSHAAAALADWEWADRVLGLGQPKTADAPEQVLQLIEKRQQARKARDFKLADAIRDELKALGWSVEDTPKGPKPRKI